ncbi:phosphotransferase enzyme family protein [Paenibacillus silvisoli]|uniref:phosphotransferase enzyme family protein n=1 Tax=Paenibacillus silvisoli TaxID=3110539 RepID=UPI002804FBFD|nr:phosphotransferase [Paenibacillus silvisoli]
MLHHAERAVAAYPIQAPILSFIRHNENMTCKVTDQASGAHFLLRIHRSATAGLSGMQHELAGLQAEMALLRELDRQGTLRVQKPVPNRNGEYVTTYRSEELGTVYATMLEWVDGETLAEATPDDQLACKLGENLADLHRYSRSCAAPDMARPSYGAKRIDDALGILEYGVEAGVYSAEQFAIIREVLGLVKQQMRELDTRGGAFGLIHSDFQRNNVVVAEGRNPVFIDYCLYGNGYYLFDVGSAATMFKGEARKAFLKGYASKEASFSAADIRFIEGQILWDIFISYSLFIKDAERGSWIKDHAARICGTLALDFIAGKNVFDAF